MLRLFFLIATVTTLFACNKRTFVSSKTTYFPKEHPATMLNNDKSKVWVFIMAGQSNMAGRGLVEASDTLSDNRIFTINKQGELILAKEPLHFYEPSLTGLDCGLSFAKAVLKKAPADVILLLLPVAVGGSSISQWLSDSVHRNVKLYRNFLEKIAMAKKSGILKAILWHQGESDANEKEIKFYYERLSQLLIKFRSDAGNKTLPVLIGELGYFKKYQPWFSNINSIFHQYAETDKNVAIISAAHLQHKGDSLHFNSKAQRLLGKRFAKIYAAKFINSH